MTNWGGRLSHDLYSNPFLWPATTDDNEGRQANDDADRRRRNGTPNTDHGFPTHTIEPHVDGLDAGPSIFSAIWRNRLPVCAAVVLVGAIGASYTVLKRPAYLATATIAMVQPPPNQALGEVSDPTPAQYLDSQVVLMSSEEVAQQAAAIGNATLHQRTFNPGDFSGPDGHVSITSQTVTDSNNTVVEVGFAAGNATDAQEGANALLLAYNAVLDEQIKVTVSSAVSALEASIANVNNQIALLQGKNSPLDAQLETSLVTQRTDLMNQQAQALVDERVALSEPPPMTLAFLPHSRLIKSLAKMGGLGAVIGFLIGVCLAYVLELRRARVAPVSAQTHFEAPIPSWPRLAPARELPVSQGRAP
jgi:hypothetical protein